MAQLTIPQIAQLALNAGVGLGQQLYVCTAIAMAESGGKTDAVNNRNTDGTIDVGVWQINDVNKRLWSGRQDDRTDPVQNAKYMFALSAGISWGAWTTYKDGTYQKYMQQVMNDIQAANLSKGKPVDIPNTLGGGYGTAPQIEGVTNPLDIPRELLDTGKDAYKTIDAFFKFITSPEGWIRILKVGIGMLFILFGVVLFMKSDIQTVAKALL